MKSVYALLGLVSTAALAADVGPVMSTQILSIDESRKAKVDINNRLKVDATFSVLPVVTANQGTQGMAISPWYVNLRNAAGTEIGTSSNPIRNDPTGTTPQPASQSGTWNLNNISGTITLPTGTATAANQSTEITSLQLLDDVPTAFNGAFSKGEPGMGQLDDTSTVVATEDNMAPYRITAQRGVHTNLRNASGTEVGTSGAPLRIDPTGTTPQPASQSGTWNITNISGVVSLPTGAATAANQSTEITSLQLIDDVPTAFNGAFSKGTPIMGQLDDAATTAATEDNVAPVRVTAQRALHLNLRNASGVELGVSGAPVRVDPTGTTIQPTSAPGVVSTVNSSTTPLGISGVFTGAAEDTLNYGMVTVSVFSNVASATMGLSVQWSSDATNWDSIDTYTINAATGKTFTFGPAARYLRVVYTNGAVAQASFRLQTVLRQVFVKPSTHKIDESIPVESDSELVSAVLRTKNPSTGVYDSTSSTNPVPTRETLRSGAVYSRLTVGTTGVEVRVGGSRLVGRRAVVVTPMDADMFWCLEATCSNCTTANGMPIFKSQMVRWGIDDTAPLCLVASGASKSAAITESP